MGEGPQDDADAEHTRRANRRTGSQRRERDQLLERMADEYERDQHVREWWVERWKCFWGVLTKAVIILGLAGAAADLPDKLFRALAPYWPAPVDRRPADRPTYFDRGSRGH